MNCEGRHGDMWHVYGCTRPNCHRWSGLAVRLTAGRALTCAFCFVKCETLIEDHEDSMIESFQRYIDDTVHKLCVDVLGEFSNAADAVDRASLDEILISTLIISVSFISDHFDKQSIEG